MYARCVSLCTHSLSISRAHLCCTYNTTTTQAAPDLSDSELQRLFTALDVDNTGSVDAQEFFAGVLQAVLLPQQTHTVLEASFKLLDRYVMPDLMRKGDLRNGVKWRWGLIGLTRLFEREVKCQPHERYVLLQPARCWIPCPEDTHTDFLRHSYAPSSPPRPRLPSLPNTTANNNEYHTGRARAT